jgi:hypothetical protein
MILRGVLALAGHGSSITTPATSRLMLERSHSWRSGGAIPQPAPEHALANPGFPARASGSRLGSNPDPDPDNRHRYEDHQRVYREPLGYAFRRLLDHSLNPPQTQIVQRKSASGCELVHI